MTGPETPGSDTQREGRQIPEPERRVERLAGLLILGLAFLNYPLLSIFSAGSFAWGIPALYFYLFSVWSFIIGVTAFVLRNRRSGPRASSDSQDPAGR